MTLGKLAVVVLCSACASDELSDNDIDDQTPSYDPRFDIVSDAFQDELDSYGLGGVAVAIVENGQLVFSGGYGYADWGDEWAEKLGEENQEPREVTGSTLFRIGSVTKMITAAATLTEVDKGALDLNQSLLDVLPDLEFATDASWAPALRLDHLLTHQGGFYDWVPMNSGEGDALLESMTYEVFDDFVWPMVTPGEFWNYSNPNYSLVGLVGQQSSGLMYRDLVDQRVVTPLGMDRTFFLAEEVESDGDFATAWSPDWTGQTTQWRHVEPSSYDDAWSRPAGFAWSSVQDLVVFANFIMNGDESVLSTALQQGMSGPQVSTLQLLDLEHYGHGLMVSDGFFLGSDWYADKMYSHTGAIPGFSASVYMLPEHDFAIAILANASGSYFGESLVTVLSELVDLSKSTIPQSLLISNDPTDYVGQYADPWNVGDFEVSVVNGGLEVSMPDLDAAGVLYEPQLTGYSPDNYVFWIDGVNVVITFVRDDSGTVQYWRCRHFVGEKIDEGKSNNAVVAQRESMPVGLEQMLSSLHREEPNSTMVLRTTSALEY